MDVVQVHVGEAEALQGLFDGGAAVLGGGVDGYAGGGRECHAEFGGEEDVFALFGVGGEPFADEVFGVSVEVG